MFIGIISDTHDDMAAIRKAVDFLNSEGVSHVIHAGDLVSPFTFEVFIELRCGLTAIFGNNDGDRVLLKQRFEGNIHQQPLVLTLGMRRIVVVHEPDLVDALSDSGHFELVVHGHTHAPEIRKKGDALVINPGKVAKLHKGESTLVLLNTETMQAKIVQLTS